MFRKLAMGIGLLALGSYMWMGTSVGSYARTGVHEVMGCFHGSVPIEFELKRAKQLIEEITPDIQSTVKAIAEEEVKVARLHREVQTTAANLESERVAIVALREQLSKDLTSYEIGSKQFTKADLTRELNRRFNSYKRVDGTLETKKEMLVSRESALSAAREKYEGLIEAKQRLEAELASLEARNTLIDAKATANQFQVDDSQLSRVRQLIDDLNDRIEVKAKVAEAEGNLVKQIPVEELPPSDLGAQIDSYFDRSDKPTSLSL